MLAFGHKYSFRLVDRGLLELFGPYGIQNLMGHISKKIRELQTGYIYNYALAILLGLSFISYCVTLAVILGSLDLLLSYIDMRLVIILTINLFIYFLRSK